MTSLLPPVAVLSSAPERRTDIEAPLSPHMELEMTAVDWVAFVPGAKVVCVKNVARACSRFPTYSNQVYPEVGEIYTIRTACPPNKNRNELLYLKFVEISNRSLTDYSSCSTCGEREIEFSFSYFRPVKTIEQKQSTTTSIVIDDHGSVDWNKLIKESA